MIKTLFATYRMYFILGLITVVISSLSYIYYTKHYLVISRLETTVRTKNGKILGLENNVTSLSTQIKLNEKELENTNWTNKWLIKYTEGKEIQHVKENIIYPDVNGTIIKFK